MATKISGTWSAVNVGGKTVYKNKTQTIDGPVYLGDGQVTLVVTSGAVASGIVTPLSGFSAAWSVISVMNGGVVESSHLSTVVVRVSGGGIVRNNTLNHTSEKILDGGFVTDNVKSNGGELSANSGATVSGLDISDGSVAYVLSGGSLNGATIGSGGKAVIKSGGAATDHTILSGGSGSYVTDRYPGGAWVSGVNAANGAHVRISSISRSVSEDPAYPSDKTATITGNWSVVNVGGRMVYQSGDRSIDGPVYLSGGQVTLIVTSGAVASGVRSYASGWDTGWSYISVLNGGVLMNSHLDAVVVRVSSGGFIRNNELNHTSEKLLDGAVMMDNVKYHGGDVTASSGATITRLDNRGGSTVYIKSGASITDSTVGSGGVMVVSSGGARSTLLLMAGI